MQVIQLTPTAGVTTTGVPTVTNNAEARTNAIGASMIARPAINYGHNGRCCLQVEVGGSGTDPSWSLEGRLVPTATMQVIASGTTGSAGSILLDLTLLPEMQFNVTANASGRNVKAWLKHDGL